MDPIAQNVGAMEPTRRNSSSDGKISGPALQRPRLIRSPAASQCSPSSTPGNLKKLTVRRKNNEENESPKVPPRSLPSPRKEITKPPGLPPSGKNLRSVTSFLTCHVRRATVGEPPAAIRPTRSVPATEIAKAKNVPVTGLISGSASAWPLSPAASTMMQTPTAPRRTPAMKPTQQDSSGGTIVQSAVRITLHVAVPVTETTRHVSKARSFSGPSSAWALSPGRSKPPTTLTNPASFGGMRHKSVKMSSILSLFRPRKTFSGQEEAAHQLRILHTRLIQWRFVNARTQEAIDHRTLAAENQSLKAWVRISHLRGLAARKSMEVERLRSEIKLSNMLSSQITYLDEWEKMEKKHLEAVCRTSRRLQAVALRVPIVDGAKGDTSSILAATYAAMAVMDRIQNTVGRFLAKTSSMGSSIVKLAKITRQERASLVELKNLLSTVAMLEAQEHSLRAHLVEVCKNYFI